MLSLANEPGAVGFETALRGAPSGLVDMAPTRANTVRLGLMGPDGQVDGLWASSVSQSNVVGVPLPPLGSSVMGPSLPEVELQQRYVGGVTQAVSMGWSEAFNPENSIGDRLIYGGLALAGTPNMMVESALYAPLNAAPVAREMGQYIARAGLQTDSAERSLDILRAVGTGAEAFSATGAWLTGPRSQAGTMSAQELASVQASYQIPRAPWDDFSPNVSWGHVFEGELRSGPNGTTRALGYHHESQFSPSTTRVVPGTETPLDANGVYRAKIEIHDPTTGVWIEKKALSSFFPKSWSPEQVNAEVISAFENKIWLDPQKSGIPRS